VNGFQNTSVSFNQTVFMAKLNSTGSSLLYSTYIGVGAAHGIAIDAAGNAYVTGDAISNNLSLVASPPRREPFRPLTEVSQMLSSPELTPLSPGLRRWFIPHFWAATATISVMRSRWTLMATPM
jgi:beta-propeller repeat-containing protein